MYERHPLSRPFLWSFTDLIAVEGLFFFSPPMMKLLGQSFSDGRHTWVGIEPKRFLFCQNVFFQGYLLSEKCVTTGMLNTVYVREATRLRHILHCRWIRKNRLLLYESRKGTVTKYIHNIYWFMFVWTLFMVAKLPNFNAM